MATRLEPHAYALLRITAGAMFMFHSFSKLFDWHGGAKAVGSQLWVGGVIELVGGALIALGLFTRPAAFLASGTMAVAYIQFHWKFDLSEALWPIVNKGEMAALYCFVFLFVAARGAGAWSIDHLRRR
jgi:putative oxidoreductase